MSGYAFTVHGTPAPQGSKTIARSKAGRVWMRDDNRATEPWRATIQARAQQALGDGQPLNGPVQLRVIFRFARPQTHYRKNGQLRPSSPLSHAKRPDLDKLLRAVGDALSGVLLIDDSQITSLTAEKIYGIPGCTIEVDEVRP
jgi:crossover junction endodeoxyribonuclease RusA